MKAPILPRPYADDRVDIDWTNLPVVWLSSTDLIPTQECVRLDRAHHLWNGGYPEGDDQALHIVQLDGQWLIHDGHTRWLLAVTHRATVPCRVWRLS